MEQRVSAVVLLVELMQHTAAEVAEAVLEAVVAEMV
jgi:hypothetical protein